METATWCRTPAAASAACRLRPEVSKNSSTALSSNEGELARSITTCVPAMASLRPWPVMVLTPVLGEAATTSWPLWRRMGTVLEPIRPVPPIMTIFIANLLVRSPQAGVCDGVRQAAVSERGPPQGRRRATFPRAPGTACPSRTPSAGLHPLEIWLEDRAHLGTGPVQQHPGVSLLKPESVTHLLRRAALDVTQNQHQPLVLGQRRDGALEVLTCLLGQEPALRRGSQVGRRVRPAARLGRMVDGVDGLEMVRGDHGLGRLDRGVETRERHHPSLAGGSGLRAVDEDAKDPGLE